MNYHIYYISCIIARLNSIIQTASMNNYFKGLDTLRAIAALVVVWGHVENVKYNASIPSLEESSSILFPDSHLAVILFFVLSGFLITHLLVNERDKTGDISFKSFYMRRILRIWPLYYAIILLSYLLIEANYTFKSTLLCLTIFPNIAHALDQGWPSSPQIWSIGVEEQFYLLWPLVFYVLPEKRLSLCLILFFIAYSLFPHVYGFVNVRHLHQEELGIFINKLFYGTKFNCMAIGAFMGFSVARKKKWVNYISHYILVTAFIVLSIGLWFFRFKLSYFQDEFFAVIFSVVIVGVVNNPKVLIDTKVSSFLGKISYGIYIYHWLIIMLAFKYIHYDGNLMQYNILLYSIVFIATILISWLSYISYERFFLNIKKRYSTH